MAASSEDAASSLPQLFLLGWEARRKIEACELSPGSPEHAKCLSDGVAALESATHLANQLSLFSDNEQVEEVATASLKYMLLPALLGDLTLQNMAGDRLDTIRKARVYFVDYLQRCKSYGITKEDPPPLSLPPSPPTPSTAPSGGRKSYEQLAAERTAKIQRLKQQKELQKKAEELTALLKAGETGSEDGEDREQWVAMLSLWVYKCQDLVKSVEEEAGILQHMERVRREGPVARRPEGASGSGPPKGAPQQPMKPLVITREMLKGTVFGAGYPSVPSMSVEEFYQQRYSGSEGGGGGGQEEEVKGKEGKEEEEGMEDEDSEEALKKARDWDEFKDDNRRGWGNKRNMG